MQLNLSEVDESISEKMFLSILLKGLPLEIEKFFTLENMVKIKSWMKLNVI